MIALSKDTEILVEIVFTKESEIVSAKASLMYECAENIPFCSSTDPLEIERIRFAAVKVSGGSLTQLNVAIQQAKFDWRDLLVSAGFANDVGAHKAWAKKTILKAKGQG